MKSIMRYIRSNFYLDILAIFLFVLSFFIEPLTLLFDGKGFVFNPVEQVFQGYMTIIQSPSIMLTDYVYIAGIGATLFNVSTILIINLILIRGMKIKLNGPIYAGLIMIAGFSFFGKNIFNTLPIYFGIYLFSLFKKIPFKSFIISILFSTGISPLVSYCFFGFGLELYYAVPLGVLCGVIVGFIIPAFASHTIVFHEGYNLYNTGFALGVISAIFYALFNFFNLNVETVSLYDYSSSRIFYILLPSLSILSIAIAIFSDHHVFSKFYSLTKTTGRLISDYARDYRIEAVLFNFGTLGLFLFAICLLFNVPINGIIFGSILSILGFAGYGLHLRNVLSVWIGAGITIFISMLIRQDFTLDISTIMCFIFASGLAPISGRYGIVYGLIGGMLHIVLTPIMLAFQGGFDLYNNGLSAGFEAAILCVCAEKIFIRGKDNARKS